jgi:uncharacterized oligopeptide transporter (OPT) family protein
MMPAIMDFLLRIEETAFSTWIRESNSIFAYPTILFLHSMGMAIVAGMSGAVDLRVLGVADRMPLAPLEKFFRVIWVGFWISAISGFLLLIAGASTKTVSGVFWIKLAFIATALIIQRVMRKKIFRDPLVDKKPVPMDGRALAAASLLLWCGAITAGRLMAYIGASAAERDVFALISWFGGMWRI